MKLLSQKLIKIVGCYGIIENKTDIKTYYDIATCSGYGVIIETENNYFNAWNTAFELSRKDMIK